MEYIIGFVITIGLLSLGFLVGGLAERSHFKRLTERERALSSLIRTQSRAFLGPSGGGPDPHILCAETVIASDYFKNFLAAFRKFFGGEMRSYNTLMDRARRETVVKMMEQAAAQGFNAICNVRLEPADIGGNFAKKGAAMVCIIGTATAYRSDLATG